MNECLICYSELLKDNTLKIDGDQNYNICFNCVRYQLDNKVKDWIISLKNEDCEATIIRMLSSGIPLQLDKDVKKFYFNKQIISGYFFKEQDITKIIIINQELKELKDKIKEIDFEQKLNLILNKIDIN